MNEKNVDLSLNTKRNNSKVVALLIILLLVLLIGFLIFKVYISKQDDANVSYVTQEVFQENSKGWFAKNNEEICFRIYDKVENKYFLYNDKGEKLSSNGYSSMNDILVANKIYFIVKDNNKYGIINSKAEVVVPLEYDYIDERELDDAGLFIVEKNQKLGAININNDVIIDIKYDKYYYNGGQALVDFQFRFTNGYASFIGTNGKVGIIDSKGKIVIEPQYSANITDNLEEDITEMNYNYISDYNGYFNEIVRIDNKDYFIVVDNGKYGVINETKTLIIPFEYDHLYLSEFLSKFIGVKGELESDDAKSYVIDNKGKILKEYNGNIWNECSGSICLGDNLYFSTKDYGVFYYLNGNKVLLDKDFNIVNLEKQNIIDISDNSLIKKVNDAYFLYNHDNKKIIDEEFMFMTYDISFNKTYVYACKKLNFTTDDHTSIPFSEASKCGWYTDSGKQIAEPIYDYIYTKSAVDGNYIILEKDGKHGIIKENGDWIVKLILDGDPKTMSKSVFDYMDEKQNLVFNNKYIITSKNDIVGMVDKNGKQIINSMYKEISYVNDNLIVATTSDGKNDIYNSKGEKINLTDNYNASLGIYIGEYNEKYYFLTASSSNAGIYYITKK